MTGDLRTGDARTGDLRTRGPGDLRACEPQRLRVEDPGLRSPQDLSKLASSGEPRWRPRLHVAGRRTLACGRRRRSGRSSGGSHDRRVPILAGRDGPRGRHRRPRVSGLAGRPSRTSPGIRLPDVISRVRSRTATDAALRWGMGDPQGTESLAGPGSVRHDSFASARPGRSATTRSLRRSAVRARLGRRPLDRAGTVRWAAAGRPRAMGGGRAGVRPPAGRRSFR